MSCILLSYQVKEILSDDVSHRGINDAKSYYSGNGKDAEIVLSGTEVM